MKDCFYENSDINFINACNIIQTDYSHADLINFLKNGNIPQKQFAALSLENINNQEEFKIFFNNLTGCDGKIREAVAYKLLHFVKSNSDIKKYFEAKNSQYFANILSNATIDINANICRSVIETVEILKDIQTFSSQYLNNILSYINETFGCLDKFIYKDKKYVINKQLFKLYWLLEALKIFAEQVDEQILLQTLTRASKESEYTVREQVAKIVVLLNSPKFDELKICLKQDVNYYVKAVFNDFYP